MPDFNSRSLPSRNLSSLVLENLKLQHRWAHIQLHTHSPCDPTLALPRPLITGLPPKRTYIHPDEQIEALEIERQTGARPPRVQEPEYEWVVPAHVDEEWSLRQFAEVFDAIDALPPQASRTVLEKLGPSGKDWRGKDRKKRALMAIIHDDSTIVYYIVHDGMVKPRQN